MIDIDSSSNSIDFSLSLSKGGCEEFSLDYFRHLLGLLEECLRDSGIGTLNVHDVGLAARFCVVLVGGACLSRTVQTAILLASTAPWERR